MKVRAHHYALLAALLPLAACSGNPPPAPPAMTQPAPSPLSEQDSLFIMQAAQGGMAEVKDGQMAATKGGTAAVRAFGIEMVNAHSQINAQLMAIAQSKNATVPSDVDPTQAAMQHKLQGLRGRTFDTLYLRDQVVAHQHMIELLQQEIADGTDPDLKTFAQQTLPIVKGHLAKAQALLGHGPTRRAPMHHAAPAQPAG